jgi:hypothetical protein
MKASSRRDPLTGVSRQAEWRRRVMRRAHSPRARIDVLVSPEARAQFRAVADANNWRGNEAMERIIAAAYACDPRARRIA